MTVTERERRRMELVDGSAHRTELCEQLAMREYELDNLKNENANLRELLRKVEHYECLGCHECPYADGCEAYMLYDEECLMSREIKRMKRELGIEVVA